MENEFGIFKLVDLDTKERFWYGGVKFIKLRPAKDNPNLIYCEMEEQKNHFVFISKNAEVEREL